MYNLVQAAYNHHQLLAPAVAPLFAPMDPIAGAYPPLAALPFYAMNVIGGPMLNCAQSALLLASTRVFEDKVEAATKANAPPPVAQPPVQLIVAAAGFTRMQMIRYLSHNGMRHFPIYEFEVQRNRFTLIFGRPREDQHAIVFLPADPPMLPVAHWTYGSVDHYEAVIDYTPITPMLIYTRFVISSPNTFWRARVEPANLADFQRERNLGRACDCIWDEVCEHEIDFLQLNPQTRRITLEGEWHVEGTLRATVLGSLTRDYMVSATGSDETRQRTISGSYVISKGVRSGAMCCKARTLKNWWDGLFHTNEFADMNPIGVEYVYPLKIELQRFIDEEQVSTIDYGNVARIALCKLAHSTAGNYVYPLETALPQMGWAEDVDLSLRLPRKAELLARLAAKTELTEDNVLDVLRRIAAEERWDIDWTRDELRVWLDRVVTQKGHATIATPGRCLNCNKSYKTHRRICKDCKRRAREYAPERLCTVDETVTYVGLRPLWSSTFRIPEMDLKTDVVVEYRKKVIYPGMDYYGLKKRFERDIAPLTLRGWSAGPIFLSQEPTCFPRGEGTACLAFMVRLGSIRKHAAQDWFYDMCYRYLKRLRIDVIEPESKLTYLAHFRGQKLIKNLEAVGEIANGWLPTTKNDAVAVKMTGFPKAEKSMAYEWKPYPCHLDKSTTKPRFICSPNAMMLFVSGRYTHAQTKWMAKRFTWEENLYYAGCSNPDELNKWLNRTLRMIPDPYSIVDDITAIDSNHSIQSFRFHRRVRRRQFPKMDDFIKAVFDGEEHLVIRVGHYVLRVNYVNASGVSDTSYKNTLICLIVRAFAVLHGFIDIRDLNEAQLEKALDDMLKVVAISASGDDGLTRVPDKVLGIPIYEFSVERYREAWSWAGFDVKVGIMPPNRWRMATFLAMRPVWSGFDYQWAPEPARRLRSMYWQIDNTMHHVAWARGVSTQVLLQSKHLPVLSDICSWFLEITKGPIVPGDIIDLHMGRLYSPFTGYETTGYKNTRALREFCVDYHVDERIVAEFVSLLHTLKTPYVNFSGFLFQRIFQEES